MARRRAHSRPHSTLAVLLAASAASGAMVEPLRPPPRSPISLAVSEAAIEHAVTSAGRQLHGVQLAKPLSEALLAAAAANDEPLSSSILEQMAPALDGDDSSLAMWIRGRVLLSDSLLTGSALGAVAMAPYTEAVYASLKEPLDPLDPCAGWACAYWVASHPIGAATHARWRGRLECAVASHSNARRRDPHPSLLH